MDAVNEPLVSVVICTFNRREKLRFAVGSVTRQSHGNLDIIVANDGGEDVGTLLASFRDERIRYMNFRSNRGKAACLNDCIAEARGKYIAYIDDDDRWYPHHVSTLVAALEDSDFGAAYSDLYKVYLRRRGPELIVMGKVVHVSRDFDREFLFFFNHVLHVSFMHRRDLLEKTGPYNPQLSVLIDWDMTRKLAFYTDFVHVPEITGEYTCEYEHDSRMSVRERRDEESYTRNVRAIRWARPPKPWPKVKDVSIVFAPPDINQVHATKLRDIAVSTCHPFKVYLAAPAGQIERLAKLDFCRQMPLEYVPLDENTTAMRALDRALEAVEGDYVVWLEPDAATEDEWLEQPLSALEVTGKGATRLGDGTGGSVLARGELLKAARRRFPGLGVADCLAADGAVFLGPDDCGDLMEFDYMFSRAKNAERDGDFGLAVKIYEVLRNNNLNRTWMTERQAKALLELEQFDGALALCGELNARRPTPETLLLEAQAHRKKGTNEQAVALLKRAHHILTKEAYA